MRARAAAGDGVGLDVDAVAVGVPQGTTRLPAVGRPLDRFLGGALAAPLRTGDLAGKAGEIHVAYGSARARPGRGVLLGLGPADDMAGGVGLRAPCGALGRMAARRGWRRVGLLLPASRRADRVEAAARAAVEGFLLGAYRAPASGKTRARPGRPPTLTVLVAEEALLRPARQGVRFAAAVAAGVALARDLINRPGNELPPRRLAAAARRLARAKALRSRVLGVRELERLGAGGLLAVGRGSAEPPCLIEVEHRSRRRGAPTVCVVGKGITFDTGGISIKPALNMEKMKYDMAGAGAVLGVMAAVKDLALAVNVHGIIAAAENMPSGKAYRPGDVITLSGGVTVEVINTDAEGRLVLGDALAHAARRRPDAIVDLATLTGGCLIALGSEAIALLANDDGLARDIERAGEASGERVWRLPLWKEYRRLMSSEVADVRNSGGREAATIQGGIFLERFAGGLPWAHLDIAGTAWSDADRGHRAKGGTGVGVALVTRFMADRAARR